MYSKKTSKIKTRVLENRKSSTGCTLRKLQKSKLVFS
jgi:hypothetical protein